MLIVFWLKTTFRTRGQTYNKTARFMTQEYINFVNISCLTVIMPTLSSTPICLYCFPTTLLPDAKLAPFRDFWIKLLLVMFTHLCLFWTQNTTEIDFLTMVEAPGDNPAKQAMNKFITDNTVIFDAFKWSTRKFVTKNVPTTYSRLTCMHATVLLCVIAWWIPI